MQVHVTCIVCGNSGSTQLYESTFEGTLEEAADHFLAHR
ncbi:MAG: hypothetical protein JWR21_1, partial [Herminiimonas sp.]|nr:hypothetical protein [Herminiimonas sp.]